MKEKIHFDIVIKAPVEKVWDTMLAQETYKKWTSAFDPTSYYEGSWEQGSKIKFLSTSGGGMVSEIVGNIKHQFVSIKHLGEIKDGVEDTTSEEVKKWAPVYENYSFTDKGSETRLDVQMEMESSPESKEMKKMFEEMWPKALLILKEICEE